MILRCSCTCDKHGNTRAVQYQDEKYGERKRVLNKCAKSTPPQYRCTICGHTQSSQ